MLLGMFLLWGVLIALAVWGVGRLFPRRTQSSGGDERETTAREVLARRYARGEISRHEYESIGQDIEQGEEECRG